MMKARQYLGSGPAFGTLALAAMLGVACPQPGVAREALAAQQQQGVKVSGVVSDSQGPIIGASVVEKGNAKNGTVTDLDGRFTLTVKPGATLVVSYIGYKTAEVSASKASAVTLVEDAETLNDVVVVGFGTQKKINLTGAVDQVTSKEISERPVANALQALQGISPGLVIEQGSGSVASRASVNVRGTGTIGQGSSGGPLILIDGMEAEISSVNPQDIESISVLKDAAASSIYGSRAPFGVILITTKNGTESKPTINYNNSFRFSQPVHRNHQMNSVEFASWMNDTFVNQGSNIYFGIDPNGNNRFNEIVEYANATPVSNGVRQTADGKLVYGMPRCNSQGQWVGGFSNGVDDVDYYDLLYKDWGFSQNHNVSATGGTKKFSYYASGSFYQQKGLIRLGDEGLNRFTVTSKIQSELTPWLKFRYNMRFTREDQHQPYSQGWFYGGLGQNCWPVLPPYDQNGNPFYSSSSSMWVLKYGGDSDLQYDNIYHQAGFTIEPIKNWLTNVDFSYRTKQQNDHSDKLPYYNYDKDGNQYDRDPSSWISESNNKTNYYNFSARTEYSFSLAEKHNFHVMAGMQVENLKGRYLYASRNGIMEFSKRVIDLTDGLKNGEDVPPGVGGSRSEWSVMGFFGRLNYDYKSRYLLEANIRRDGSSRFRKDNRWKAFPSFSVGWNIAEEAFMEKSHSWLDQLKLRLSYGTLGNQNTDNWYQTYVTMGTSSTGNSWLQNGKKSAIAYIPGLVSEALTWEEVETYNIGLDLVALNNRLTGTFNWYVRNTNNMVGPAPALPAVLGTSVPVTNNTDLRTLGWELTLGWRDRLACGLNYSVKMNVFDSRTKIVRYPNNPTRSIDNYCEGRYINEYWGYVTKGLARTDEEMKEHLASLPNGGQDKYGSNWGAGDIMYTDLNGDGVITSGTRTENDHGDLKLLGNSTPRYSFGLDLNASFKGFDFRAFFTGTMKRDFFTDSRYMFGTPGGQWGCAAIKGVLDYFRDENTWSVKQGVNDVNLDAFLPRPQYNNKNLQVQTRYMQNAAYIRLKNLTLGYTLPKALTSRIGIGAARLYFSAENIFTITGLCDQFDPESLWTDEGNAYPLQRTLSCGLSVTF